MQLILKENFSFLVDQLIKFDDPTILYKKPLKLPNLRGGKRRVFRANEDSGYYTYMVGATITTDMTSLLNFGGTQIPITEYNVSHPSFKNTELGERYLTNTYSCKITSLKALQDKITDRVYIKCSCSDFRYTFNQKLIDAGYTLPDQTLSQPTGVKKLAPAICKHLYTIIMRKYALVLFKESGPIEDATTDVFMKQPAAPPVSTTITGNLPSVTTQSPAVSSPSTQPKIRLKTQYIQDLTQKIKDLDKQAEIKAVQDPTKFIGSGYSEYYRDSHISTKETYYLYKFKTRSFGGIRMIVYTNPSAWNAAGTIVLPDAYKGKPLEFYKLLQSYGTLTNLIKDNSTELDVSIRDSIWQLKLKNQKIPGAIQYAMVEGSDFDETELSLLSLIESI